MNPIFKDGNQKTCPPFQTSSVLSAEVESGNIEYKTRLDPSSSDRFNHLVTQMKWRLAESAGHGEAIYELGVRDDGSLLGLSHDELESSLMNLRAMAEELDAEVSIIREIYCGNGRKIIETLVRKRWANQNSFVEVRIATVGDHEAGKSTLLGVMTQGEPDNGRGKARLNLFRHRHEIESGHTSHIAIEVLGYDSAGRALNYSGNFASWEEIVTASSKVITFIDCCGLPHYTKHTIRGLTGHSPDYACAMVPANTNEISHVTQDHLSICHALGVPLFLLVTKLDIATKVRLRHTLKRLYTILKESSPSRVPFIVQDQETVVAASQKFSKETITPIFFTSSVTKMGISLLHSFLNLLQKPPISQSATDSGSVFQIEDVYDLAGTGLVVGGMNKAGRINVDDTMWIGPISDKFYKVTINSIHRQRIPTKCLIAGQAGAMSISSSVAIKPKKGMVLLQSGEPPPIPHTGFMVDALCLSGILVRGCQAVAHCGSVRAVVKVVSISPETIVKLEKLHSGQKARVRFDMVNSSEWISLGENVLVISAGPIKVSGQVTELYIN
ncbi:GTP-binding protein 2 [Neolecta irregularis DAH-3]|uniref:GTP-binding protein 2 n=1 Tax=Neolecta irregularis (strain DAH-3) TaxID=1198029 RepID=A0A1U7LGR2_NEOID|nr:GTP-binding protein 2 [Neolecta irregularis DAH-3]|eukprot:OLL21837.1 GTP-binding protein 2 [Neolecta irregularis DAH-3]